MECGMWNGTPHVCKPTDLMSLLEYIESVYCVAAN